MKSFFAFALLSAIPALALLINTPTNVVFCQPQLITWTGGTPPYYPAIIPGGQPSAPALKQFDETSETSLRWLVDIQGAVTLLIRDSSGETQFTDVVNIREGKCSQKDIDDEDEGEEEGDEGDTEDDKNFAVSSAITAPPYTGPGGPTASIGGMSLAVSSGTSPSGRPSSSHAKPTGATEHAENKAPVLLSAALGFIGFATLLVAIAM